MSVDLRSPLARARDAWLNSAEGKDCLAGSASGQWLETRLVLAFLAGAKAVEGAERQAIAEAVKALISSSVARGHCSDCDARGKALLDVLDLLARRESGTKP